MMNITEVPMKSLRFRWQQDLTGTIVFDVKTYKSFRLNQTAFAIWNLCDGSKDVGAILDEFAARYQDVDKEKIESDLIKTLTHLRDKEMIVVNAAV